MQTWPDNVRNGQTIQQGMSKLSMQNTPKPDPEANKYWLIETKIMPHGRYGLWCCSLSQKSVCCIAWKDIRNGKDSDDHEGQRRTGRKKASTD
ncbi:hypothetical protein AA100600_2969 [Gluconobacter thailandicus F149-1 = NBRC 100600]|nr:hypothetical protein AA100600_2969 [Gluconobacter thailandicus F149-1 = NBRC 100600]